MITRERAYALRRMLVKASASLSDEDALEAVELFAAWTSGTEYATDQRLRYGGKLYRVRQDHTSQADWLPSSTPSLYAEVEKPGQGDTPDHPILYNGNMELIEGKYYSEDTLSRAEYTAWIGDRAYEIELIPQDFADVLAKMITGETVTTNFRVIGGEDSVHAGDFAVLMLKQQNHPDVLRLPVEAVYGSGDERYVYLLGEGVDRVRRDVSVGASNGLMIEITGGLEEGDRVYVRE